MKDLFKTIKEVYEQIDENKDVRKKYRGKEQKSVDKLIMQKGIDKVQKHHDKNPKEFDKMVKNLAMMEDIEEKVLYKSPTGWSFELFGGKVIIIGKNSGTYEVPTKDFKSLQKIIGQVKI